MNLYVWDVGGNSYLHYNNCFREGTTIFTNLIVATKITSLNFIVIGMQAVLVLTAFRTWTGLTAKKVVPKCDEFYRGERRAMFYSKKWAM